MIIDDECVLILEEKVSKLKMDQMCVTTSQMSTIFVSVRGQSYIILPLGQIEMK